jgi:hypothetical protein
MNSLSVLVSLPVICEKVGMLVISDGLFEAASGLYTLPVTPKKWGGGISWSRNKKFLF